LAIGDEEFPSADRTSTVVTPIPQQCSSSVLRSGSIYRVSPITVEAPARKTRTRKTIQVDHVTMLRSHELSRFNEDFLQICADAAKHKLQYKYSQQAKKNAEWLVFGRGIGNIGAGIGYHGLKGPLDMFAGDSLYVLVTGESRTQSNPKKRRRDSVHVADGSSENGRRIRPEYDAEGSGHVGSGGNVGFEDTGFNVFGDEQDIEIGRQGTAGSLRDSISSIMPWNTFASAKPSSSLRGWSGLPGSVSGVRGSHGPRARSTVSPSPLIQHGSALGGQRIGLSDFEEGRATGDDTMDLSGDYIPQASFQNMSLKAGLDDEGRNFFAFVKDAIERVHEIVTEREDVVGTDDGEDELAAGIVRRATNEVFFEHLLPPNENNHVVAAQGLLNILTLATRNFVSVKQEEPFGDIVISLLEGVA
jgi:meiotic recombination protein REC8, fungi type